MMRVMLKGAAIISGLMILLLGTMSSTGGAVALSDRVIQQMKENGTFDAYIEELRELRAQGWNEPGERPPGTELALGANAVDTQKILVILIDFDDKPYTDGWAAATPEDFDSLLFSDTLNPTGSMKNFYYENSYGKYLIDGDVVGWYHAPFDHSEYVSSTTDLVRFAVNSADPYVNFDDYDNDDDGYVDGVIVVHAGTGREESGNPNEIHSHMGSVGSMPVDGVTVSRYTIQPEESANNQSMSGIGVFCHEWGHILYLPDLYDTDYSSEGVGRWSLMGSGNYNGSSRSPAHLDPWCKMFLGWLNLTNVMFPMTAAQIPAIEHNPVAYRMRENGSAGSQYWILENRYQTGFDVALPGYGLLIYHIDASQGTNNNDWHPKVFVEQADGRYDLQWARNRGDGSDPWPDAGRARNFHDKTDPGSKYYSSASSQVGVWNISDPDSVMTADLEVTFSRPWVESGGIELSDEAYGNGNGIPEVGERIQLIMALVNDWAEASDITVTMTTDDPVLDLIVASSGFPNIAMGQVESNTGSPFEFQIPGIYEPRIDSFFFDVTANGGEYQITLGGEASVGKPQLLVIDDDDGDPDQLEQYLTRPLYMTRTPWKTWVKKTAGSPDQYDLRQYPVVMWMTGDAREWLLTFSDIAAMKGYLDNGGFFFMTGQGLARQINSMDPDFLHNYLKATYRDTSYIFTPVLFPTEGPISGGDSGIVIYGSAGANNQTEYNHILPYGDGVAEWLYPGSVGPDYGGVSYDGAYKLVFFTFGFEAIIDNNPRFATPDRVMARILDFFGDLPTDVEDPDGMAVNLPYRFTLDQNYPNPFNPVTEISYIITGVGPRIDRTRLEVFNILGQQVVTLVDRDEVPGEYSVEWDGRDGQGREVASGLYFYRLTRGDQNETRKMILLK